jgi:hypothetical protein
MLKANYKDKSGEIKTCIVLNNSKHNGWFAPINELPEKEIEERPESSLIH